MAEAMPVVRKETEKLNCSVHPRPAVMGCRECLSFLCTKCVSSKDLVCIGKASHDLVEIGEVLDKLESKFDKSKLDAIKKECQHFEQNGRDAHTTLQNEKNRIDEMFETERKNIEDHLKQVRERSEAADELLKPECMSPHEHYSVLTKTIPNIELKISGENGYSVRVETDEEVEETVEEPIQLELSTAAVPDMKSKSLKFIRSFEFDADSVDFHHGPKLIVATKTAGNSTELKMHELENREMTLNGDPITREGNRTDSTISASGNTTVTKLETKSETQALTHRNTDDYITERLHNRGNCEIKYSFSISVTGRSDQEISETWCGRVRFVFSLGDEWILFLINDFIVFYSCQNYPSFNYRNKQSIKFLVSVVIPVSETKFCICDQDNKLHLYEFDPNKISVVHKWSTDVKDRWSTGCYSELFDLILIIQRGGLLMIKQQRGKQLGLFPTPEFGYTAPAKLMMIDNQILFEVKNGEKSNVLLYQLDDKKDEEKRVKRRSWKNLPSRMKDMIPSTLKAPFGKKQ